MTRREILDAAKALPVAEVLSRAGRELKRNGRGWECPVCEDRRQTRILTVNTSRWDCGHCGAKGSSADMWLRIQGLDPERLADEHYECLARLLGTSAPSRVEVVPEERPRMSAEDVRQWWDRIGRVSNQSPIAGWLESRRIMSYAIRAWPRALKAPASAPYLQALLESGQCAVWPLWSTRSGDLHNLVIRPTTQGGQKAMTLNSGPGSCSDQGFPLSYGRIADGCILVLVEGGPDWLTVSQWAAEGCIVLGARCAGDLANGWVRAIQAMPWLEKVIVVPHRDTPTERYPAGVGQYMAEQLKGQLDQIGIECRLFDWGPLLARMPEDARRRVSDLNDLIRADKGAPLMSVAQLREYWKGVVG